MIDVNDIYYKTLVMHIAQGLLAGNSERYIDIPGKKKEEVLADDVIAYANAIMIKFSKEK